MIRRIFENYENRQLKKRLAIVTKRIKELEAQLAEYKSVLQQVADNAPKPEEMNANDNPNFWHFMTRQFAIAGSFAKRALEKSESKLATPSAPKPVTCENCNSKIEGEIHLRYMAHDTISLCGACVTENED